MMKRISYILVMTAVLLTACQQKLEFLHDLTLSNSTVNMPAEESWHVVAVYSNADWTAFLAEPVEWISLDVETGKEGLGRIRLDCVENLGLKRSAKVIVKSGTQTDTLHVNQYSGVKTPEFTFTKSSVELSGEAARVSVKLSTNLGHDVERAVVSVTDAQGNVVDWISSVSVMPEAVAFSVKKTVEERQATLALTLADSDGKVYKTSLTIIQNV